MCVLPVLICLYLVSSSVVSFPQNDIPYAEPEYLDMLLETKQYELFSKLMKIENVDLVRPKEGERSEKGIFHKELEFGDILPARPATEEESRQGLRFDRYKGSKWNKGYVPYAISNSYDDEEVEIIENAVDAWNDQIDCIKLKPRVRERDYVMIFPGDGCFSSMGRVGGQQSLSLDKNGCMDTGTVLHEMEHAIGMAHEQNRLDRDNYIKMLWKNIPEEWQSQYEKTSSKDYGIAGEYDYYSLMHYPVPAPETNKPAFKILAKKVNARRVGNADDFTEEDIYKIEDLYCSE